MKISLTNAMQTGS